MPNAFRHSTFLAVVLAGIAASSAQAALLTPDFGNVPTGWVTDRYEPNSFSNVGNFQGRDNVLGIGISSAQGSANRGGQGDDFYNTHGRQHAISGGAGSTLAADLFIEDAWQTPGAGHARSDMWGVTDNIPLAYPIIGFTNQGTAGPRFRVWDGDTASGWVDLLTPVSFGSWVSFEIDFTGTAFEYSINGASVYTDNTIGTTTGFSAIIMQAYNFYDPTFNNAPSGFVGMDYVAHWDNARADAVPEPMSLALTGLALAGLAAMRRRRA